MKPNTKKNKSKEVLKIRVETNGVESQYVVNRISKALDLEKDLTKKTTRDEADR